MTDSLEWPKFIPTPSDVEVRATISNKITVQIERFSDVIEEAQPLLERHWEEIAPNRDIIPLSPNYARYAEMEEVGKLLVVTARASGELVGYACFVVDYHRHFSTTMWGLSDALWVVPEHRGRSIGNDILDYAERALEAKGVVIAYISTMISHPALAALLKSRGYSAVEIAHSKILQRPDG